MFHLPTSNITVSQGRPRKPGTFSVAHILLPILFGLILGCEASDQEVYNINGELLDDELSPRMSALMDEVRDRYDAANYLPKPFTEISVKQAVKNDLAIAIGIESSVLDVINYKAVTEMRLNYSWTAFLTLMRAGLDPIMVEEHSTATLNHQENVPFIGYCGYEASTTSGLALMGSVKVMGNGISNTTEFSDRVGVTRIGETFNVYDTDTVRSLMDMCLDDFRWQHRSATVRDLRLALNASIEPDYTYQRDDFKTGLLAAVYGPEQKRLKIHGHHWNVKPAKIVFDGDWVYLDGQISHNIRWRRDHQFYYKCEYKDGQRTSIWYNYKGDDSWKKAARRLADEICEEAYLFYREPADAPKVEGDVEVFRDSYYKNKQATIPMGKHRLSDLKRFGFVNDATSSIKVPYGLKVIAYEHDNWSGKVTAYTYNQHTLTGGMNDKISSMIVAKRGI